MADFSIKLKAEELGKVIDDIGEQLQQELETAVSDLAHGAYAKIAADAQARISNPDARQQYLKGLEIVELGPGSFLVTLDTEESNKLEDGYDGLLILACASAAILAYAPWAKSETAVSNSCWSCSPMSSMTLPSSSALSFIEKSAIP